MTISEERLRDHAEALERSLENEGGNINAYLRDDIEQAIETMRAVALSLRSDAHTSGEVTFQDRVAAAHVALFHDDPTDIAERRDRFGEEANELQQALGQTREDAHRLVDYTYDRPVGEPEKEIGAAALTLASLCVIGGWDMMACAEADLAALQTPEKIAKVRAKRATRHGRGPLPGLGHPIQGEAVATAADQNLAREIHNLRKRLRGYAIEFHTDARRKRDFLRAVELIETVASQPPTPAGVREITEEVVKRATIEFLSHKGERPHRVTRGGWELWEGSTDAMRAALAAAKGAGHGAR